MTDIDYDYYAETGKIVPKEQGNMAIRALKSFTRGTVATFRELNNMKKYYEKQYGSLWNIFGDGWIWSKPDKKLVKFYANKGKS